MLQIRSGSTRLAVGCFQSVHQLSERLECRDRVQTPDPLLVEDVVELSDTQVTAQVARLLDTTQCALQQMQHLLRCLDGGQTSCRLRLSEDGQDFLIQRLRWKFIPPSVRRLKPAAISVTAAAGVAMA
jgi:hypothetical protein